MNYIQLGSSGLRVSEICLGTMTFGKDWYWSNMGVGKEEARKIYNAYIAAGGNFIDCANYYSHGTAEKYIGEFAKKTRESLVISSKFGLSMDHDDPNASGASRKNIYRSINESLKRLQTDYVDIYWLHMWDERTPLEETLEAVGDLVRQGKVRYFGISDAPAWLIAKAATMASLMKLPQVSTMQIPFSLIERTPERELLPMAEHFNLGVLAWAPLGGGFLTGKYLDGKQLDRRLKVDDNEVFNSKNQQILKKVVSVAQKNKVPPQAVALAWVKQYEGLEFIPVLGARTAVQLKENLKNLDFRLSEVDYSSLSQISKIDYGFPRHFIEQETIQKLINGKKFWKQKHG